MPKIDFQISISNSILCSLNTGKLLKTDTKQLKITHKGNLGSRVFLKLHHKTNLISYMISVDLRKYFKIKNILSH